MKNGERLKGEWRKGRFVVEEEREEEGYSTRADSHPTTIRCR